MGNFYEFTSRKDTNSIKWDFIQFMYPDLKHEVLPLWVADMDFDCDTNILDSIKERVDKNILGYSAFDEDYYNIIISWFQKKYDYSISKFNILFAPGIVPALGILIRSLTNERDKIIIQSPVYYPFKNMIVHNKRRVLDNTLISNNGYYEINFEDLEEKAKIAKMMILCSPHNPVGRVWTEEEIIKIVDICARHDVYLISDEIHCDLIRSNKKFFSVGKLKDKVLDKLIICTSPSKSFNLAGLNLSNIIIFDEDIRNKYIFEILNKMGVANPSPLSIAATKAAYTKGDKWLGEVNSYIDSNLEYLKEFIEGRLPKIKYMIPEGTYLAWLDFSNYPLNDSEITSKILNEACVAFDEGRLFGKTGEKFQRINVACPRYLLREALEKLEEVFKEL